MYIYIYTHFRLIWYPMNISQYVLAFHSSPIFQVPEICQVCPEIILVQVPTAFGKADLQIYKAGPWIRFAWEKCWENVGKIHDILRNPWTIGIVLGKSSMNIPCFRNDSWCFQRYWPWSRNDVKQFLGLIVSSPISPKISSSIQEDGQSKSIYDYICQSIKTTGVHESQ